MNNFFFQAEDGIRDKLVTGVQTCALPIWLNGLEGLLRQRPNRCRLGAPVSHIGMPSVQQFARRSEERREGKSVDLGGRRMIKKKKEGCSRHRCWEGILTVNGWVSSTELLL